MTKNLYNCKSTLKSLFFCGNDIFSPIIAKTFQKLIFSTFLCLNVGFRHIIHNKTGLIRMDNNIYKKNYSDFITKMHLFDLAVTIHRCF